MNREVVARELVKIARNIESAYSVTKFVTTQPHGDDVFHDADTMEKLEGWHQLPGSNMSVFFHRGLPTKRDGMHVMSDPPGSITHKTTARGFSTSDPKHRLKEQKSVHARNTTVVFDEKTGHPLNGWHKVDGHSIHFVGGMRHREGGPAFIHRNRKEHRYYNYNLLHRVDGPAVLRKDGNHMHYVNGKRVDDRAV